MARAKVAIVGAGFGGLQCAKKLDGGPVDVTLIDRHNYHVFTPLLYQVASSLLNPSDIAFPIRRAFRGSSNVRFRQADVRGVDFENKTLEVDNGPPLRWDYLVLAAGSTTNFFGNESVARRSLGLKTLGEALALRNHILTCLEAASRESDKAAREAWMTFAIVGAGPTGVEYAGALSELMRLVLAAEYPTIDVPPRIIIIEGLDRVLSAFSKPLSDYTARRLEKLGVELMLGERVASADEDDVVLASDKRIHCKTLVWSAGVKAESLSALRGMPLTDRKRIGVDAHLRISGKDDAFAIGDIAGDLPQVSAPAMQQGRYVADFILAHLGDDDGDPVKLAPFAYQDKGSMATIGRNAAVCAIGNLELTGFIGWLGWLVVHIYYLIGFRNRVVVLWSWFWNYVWYDRPVRLITRAKRPLTLPMSGGEL